LWIFNNASTAQPKIEWEKNYGGTLSDEANSIQLTADGEYIVGGTSNSNDEDVVSNMGKSDSKLIKQ